MQSLMGGQFGEEWIHVYVRLNPFAVYLTLSQLFVNRLYPNTKAKGKKIGVMMTEELHGLQSMSMGSQKVGHN